MNWLRLWLRSHYCAIVAFSQSFCMHVASRIANQYLSLKPLNHYFIFDYLFFIRNERKKIIQQFQMCAWFRWCVDYSVTIIRLQHIASMGLPELTTSYTRQTHRLINIYAFDYSVCIINCTKTSLQEDLIRVGNKSKLIKLIVEKALLNIIPYFLSLFRLCWSS